MDSKKELVSVALVATCLIFIIVVSSAFSPVESTEQDENKPGGEVVTDIPEMRSVNATDVANTGVLADPPPIMWQKTFPDPDDVRAITVDSNDNIIVTGDEYIAKYDPAGNELWTIEFYDSHANFRGVAVDPSDNIIVAGDLSYDILVVKYTSGGTKLWHRLYDFDGWGWNDDANAVAVDSNGNIIVAGESSQRTTPWEDRCIVLKCAAGNGNVLWSAFYTYDPPGGAQPQACAEDVAVDYHDNVIVTGQVIQLRGFYSDWQMLTIKYKPNGDRMWLKKYGTVDSCHGVDNYADTVTVDSQDNIIIGGDCSGGDDGTLIKYNSGGGIIWEKDFGYVTASAVNSRDEIIIKASGHIYKLTPDGDEIWCLSFVDGYSATDVAVDSADNIIVGGEKIGGYEGIIVKYGISCGNMGVNPTSWNPTIDAGTSDSRTVTVSASGGPVEGVTVSTVSGPAWLSVSPTNLGDIASGTSKTFSMTASPPTGTSGDFVYTVRVSNTCGTPTTRDVTGTLHVEDIPCCGIIFPSCPNPATDPDGDGLCEDLNGNGVIDFNDVVVFFNYFDNPSVIPDECYLHFDYNGNGLRDFNDINELFAKV